VDDRAPLRVVQGDVAVDGGVPATLVGTWVPRHASGTSRVARVQEITWLGAGPYRLYKNRLRGVTEGVHTTAFNIATGTYARTLFLRFGG
jgi:hypothetical protein